MPAEALEAIENDVNDLIFRIIDLRHYAKAKQAYDEGQREPDMAKRPRGPTIDRVREIEFALAKERILAAAKEASHKS